MKRALILTLDNTLITTLSKQKYALHAEDWKFILQTVEAIRDYSSRGYRICIISNQPSITNNIISEKVFLRKMELVVSTLEKDLKLKPRTISFSYCIDDESYYKLPNPGLLYNLAIDFELDLYRSIFIGNSLEDESTAILAGIKTFITVTNLNYSI